MGKINSSRFTFSQDIMRILEDYREEVTEAVTKTVPTVARDATKKLKNESPKRTGEYAKHWKYTVNKGRLSPGATIYGDAPTFRMAHLLENGHANSGGGSTAPVVHIYPVMEWAYDEVSNRTMRELEKIT